MKMDENMRVDAQCIGIFRDQETSHWIDYFFVADFRCKDPRYVSRYMVAGECRGLFRFNKETLGAELLFPMQGDDAGNRFSNAAGKVLKEFRSSGNWPDRTSSLRVESRRTLDEGSRREDEALVVFNGECRISETVLLTLWDKVSMAPSEVIDQS